MSDKQDALKSALAQIEKNFGKGSIMTMDEKNGTQNLPSYSTGSLKLDKALGVNGIPRGRIVEIYGPESSGKTTLCLETCASVHKEGGTVLYVDTEHALDPTYAEKLGVNLEELMLSQPDTGEQALEIVDTMTRSGAVDFIVVDSVAALTPKAEIEGDMGDSHVGLQARLMSQALRKLSGLSKKTDTTIMFVNQIRMKIGVMFGCFQYNARVLLADGSTEKIGKIVNQQQNVDVLSWNPEKNIIEPKKILNWFNNGQADYFLNIVVEGGKSGRQNLPVTPNHTIFTPEGEVSADELNVGDEVLSQNFNLDLNKDQKQFLSVVPSKIVSIDKEPKTETMDKFDLEIEDNQNYLVDGVVVHNSPETTTGGNALKFYSSVRLDIRRIGSVKDMDEVIGNETRVKVAKNKVSPPFKQAEFQIIYNQGINREAELIDLAVDNNIIDKSGSWFKYDGKQIAQGRKNAEQYLVNNPEFRAMLIEQVLPKSESDKQSETDETDKDNNSNQNTSKESEAKAD